MDTAEPAQSLSAGTLQEPPFVGARMQLHEDVAGRGASRSNLTLPVAPCNR